MSKRKSISGKMTRRTGWYGASAISGLMGHLGMYGTVVSDGDNYFGKAYDGFAAAPHLAEHYYKLYADLDRVLRINNAAEVISQGASSAWESAKQFDLTGTLNGVSQSADGLKQAYDVVKEIEFNAIWNGLVNAADNITRQPVETAAAAATVYGAFWALKHFCHMYATRGQGDTVVANTKRAIGNWLWSGYFEKHPEEQLVYGGNDKVAESKYVDKARDVAKPARVEEQPPDLTGPEATVYNMRQERAKEIYRNLTPSELSILRDAFENEIGYERASGVVGLDTPDNVMRKFTVTMARYDPENRHELREAPEYADVFRRLGFGAEE